MLFILLTLSVVGPLLGIAIHVLRDRVDARRVRERGFGGTQDVAMWGTLVLFLWLVATGVCLVIAINRGDLPPR